MPQSSIFNNAAPGYTGFAEIKPDINELAKQFGINMGGYGLPNAMTSPTADDALSYATKFYDWMSKQVTPYVPPTAPGAMTYQGALDANGGWQNQIGQSGDEKYNYLTGSLSSNINAFNNEAMGRTGVGGGSGTTDSAVTSALLPLLTNLKAQSIAPAEASMQGYAGMNQAINLANNNYANQYNLANSQRLAMLPYYSLQMAGDYNRMSNDNQRLAYQAAMQQYSNNTAMQQSLLNSQLNPKIYQVGTQPAVGGVSGMIDSPGSFGGGTAGGGSKGGGGGGGGGGAAPNTPKRTGAEPVGGWPEAPWDQFRWNDWAQSTNPMNQPGANQQGGGVTSGSSGVPSNMDPTQDTGSWM